MEESNRGKSFATINLLRKKDNAAYDSFNEILRFCGETHGEIADVLWKCQIDPGEVLARIGYVQFFGVFFEISFI